MMGTWLYLLLGLCLLTQVLKSDDAIIHNAGPGMVKGNYSLTTDLTTYIDDASTLAPEPSFPSDETLHEWILVVMAEDFGYGEDCKVKIYAYMPVHMPYVYPETIPSYIALCRCWLKLCDRIFSYELTEEQKNDYDDLDMDYVTSLFYDHFDRNVVAIVGYSSAFLAGVIGNILVIWTAVRYMPKGNITNIFITSLATADLMVCVICIPVRVVRIAYDKWMLGDVVCYATSIWYFVGLTASALNLTVMGLERYIAIVFPLKAQMLNNPGRAKKTVLGIWLLAIAMSVPSYRIVNISYNGCSPKRFKKESEHYYIFLFVAVFAIPVCILAYAYGHVSVTLWKSIKSSAALKNASGKKPGEENDADAKTRLKVIQMLITVVVVFALCWGPMLAYNIWYLSGIADWLENFGTQHNYVYPFLELATYINSCLNPFLYAFFSSQFRKGFMRSLKSGPKALRGSLYTSSTPKTNVTSVAAATRT